MLKFQRIKLIKIIFARLVPDDFRPKCIFNVEGIYIRKLQPEVSNGFFFIGRHKNADKVTLNSFYVKVDFDSFSFYSTPRSLRKSLNFNWILFFRLAF